MVIWTLKKNELYAFASLEMLKARVEKIESRFSRKKPSYFKKIKVVLVALYQLCETDPLNVIHPFRYQSTETCLNFSDQFSAPIKDAVRKFINVMSKIFKGGFDSRKDFSKPSMQPSYEIVSQGIKKS